MLGQPSITFAVIAARPTMITSFTLKHGRSPGQPSQTVDATSITVFVGPNNSGKSKALEELHAICQGGGPHPDSLVIGDIQFAGFSEEAARAEIEKVRRKDQPHGQPEFINVGRPPHAQGVHLPSMVRALMAPQGPDRQTFAHHFLRHFVLWLSGPTRISLIDRKPAGDLRSEAQNSFAALFKDDRKRAVVRKSVQEAFGYYFVVDPCESGSFNARFSRTPPESNSAERSLDDAALRFYQEALTTAQVSDGVKAFSGIITEVIAGDPAILFIDEPEAFLHPSLASKLGTELAKAAQASHKRVFISTHSPAFVMGCIRSGVKVNIIRLTYKDGVSTARVLGSDQLTKMMRNPLLRSTGVISALFYENVVVTESDADRAFYQEVNERLLALKPAWGVPNCLFLQAQNKDTLPTIMEPLRTLGIPAACIVDIDLMKNGAPLLTKFLAGASVPAIQHQSITALRSSVHNAMVETGKDMKRDGGIEILPRDSKEVAQNLINQFAEYGVFIIPGGELECWLKNLAVTGGGPTWLVKMFEKMGEDPASTSYVKPTQGDVWEFIGAVKEWLANPERKGIPQ